MRLSVLRDRLPSVPTVTGFRLTALLSTFSCSVRAALLTKDFRADSAFLATVPIPTFPALLVPSAKASTTTDFAFASTI